MDSTKQAIHLYDGSIDGGHACSKCGKTAWNILHIRNTNGITCDAIDWPCACGSFHYDGEMEQKIHMANTNYDKWLRKISTPGYVLTQDDKDILEALET